jgi:hypothetical protein
VVVVVVVVILKLTCALHRYNALNAYRRYGGECPYTLFLDDGCKCAMGHKLSVVSTIKHPSI